jgi:acyl-CoA synthetase (AMP-forming)/AMP-acid ligase II
MAGSYSHVVTDDGNLGSNEHVVNMLENGGDVFEAVEEMYGMIWYLAAVLVPVNKPITAKEAVKEAQQHYTIGLSMAKKINGGGE